MRLPRIRFTIRTLLVAIGIAAVPMTFFRSEPRVELTSYEKAVEIAAAVVMQEDATYQPEKHLAKVYRECSMAPLHVDFYSEDRAYVVKRVGFIHGAIRGPTTFAECDRVTSSRDGPGMYALDRTGKFIARLPYLFGPDGEVAGVGWIPPIRWQGF